MGSLRAVVAVACSSVLIAASSRAEPLTKAKLPAELLERDVTVARWAVEVRGTACESERAAFEHELALACAAVSTCRVVPVNESELVAVLVCGDNGSWLLETRTTEGMKVSSTPLSGALDDRVREAAVEVARDVAPERTLAAATLHDSLTADTAQAPPRARKAADLTIHAASLVHAGADEVVGTGLQLGAGHRVTNSLAIMGSLSAVGGGGYEGYRIGRVSVGAGTGAPYTEDVFGVSAVLGMEGKRPPTNQMFAIPDGKVDFAGYCEATVIAQAPTRLVRPFLSTSLALRTVDGLSPTITFGIGLAVPIR